MTHRVDSGEHSQRAINEVVGRYWSIGKTVLVVVKHGA
jgi:hypothetical protein